MAESTPLAEEQTLLLQGAAILTVSGRRSILRRQNAESPTEAQDTEAGDTDVESTEEAAPLSPELEAVLDESGEQPLWEIWRALRADGLLGPGVLLVAMLFAAFGVTLEAVVLRGLIELGSELDWLHQHRELLLWIGGFVLLLLLLEVPIAVNTLRSGRRLEMRLRLAFLAKIPRLHERYFASRTVSDMTQRAHDLRQLRTLPAYGTRFVRLGFQLLFTTAGIIWLFPDSALLALLALIITIGTTIFTQPLLLERDMRQRVHAGGLSRYYLDALLGLLPLRTHSAASAIRSEHEGLLVDWVRAARSFYDVQALLQGLAMLLSTAFAVGILFRYVESGGEASGVLLLLYWALNLPVLGGQLANQAQQYSALRNSVLRVLEPLGAPEDEVPAAADAPNQTAPQTPSQSAAVKDDQPVQAGLSIVFEHASVRAGGHTILHDINLSLAPGEHVAVVGASGAGKSSLVGLLLGWHVPATGQVRIDGRPLAGETLHSLREATAWVDPTVQLWNRTLLDNLLYGVDNNLSQYRMDENLPHAASDSAPSLGMALQKAHLHPVMERLPHGLQTVLGESGGLVSGGEGQRVRLGRALMRADVRLAILDEPFRGLDRENRRQLLRNARQQWRSSTLLCVTHDVSETRTFDRVLVLAEGRIVEAGAPDELASQPGSAYARLLQAEQAVRQEMWQGAEWKRLWMEDGIAHVRGEWDNLERIHGIGPDIAARLYAAGIQRFVDLARLTPAQLSEIVMPGQLLPHNATEAWLEEAQHLAWQNRERA